MEILIIGDVFSKLGRSALERNIKRIKSERKINLIICNGENISHGRGMNEGHYLWLLNQGVNVITLGNHSWNQRSIYNIIDDAKCLVRPYNYKGDVPGTGYITINYNGTSVDWKKQDFDCYNLYKFTPNKYVFYKSLVGDNADNIKGITGIGKVRATKIVNECECFEELLEKSQSLLPIKICERLHLEKETFFINKKIITLTKKYFVNYDIGEYGFDKDTLSLTNSEILSINKVFD